MFVSFIKNEGFDGIDLSSPLFPAVEDRAFWDSYDMPGLIEAAQGLLDYTWPIISAVAFREFKVSGDRGIMEKVHFERRKNFVTLILAEAKENKGRFLPQVLNGALAICEETYWGVSAHWHPEGVIKQLPHFDSHYIDLFAAETAEHLAMAYHILKKPLTEYCPDILERIEYELDRRIKKPYTENVDFWWMGRKRKPNNWNPWIISNLITVYLALESDEQRKKAALTKMLSELQNYLDAIPEDGGCDEGADYWGLAGASLFECVYQLKVASGGKIDFFKNEKLKRIGEYMLRVHLKGPYFVCFADGVPTPKRASGVFVYAYGKETESPALMSLGKEMTFAGLPEGESPYLMLDNVRRNIYNYLFVTEMKEKSLGEVKHPPLELLRDLQVAVLREGDWTLAAKGGHNGESHNHNDVGSFALYYHGEPVLVDVGIGTYTRQTFSSERYLIPWVNSRTHNLPIINGTEQREGREYSASRFEASEGRLAVSYEKAYPAEAGVTSLERVYTLGESGLSFTDRLSFADSTRTSVTEVLMTTLTPEIKDGEVILGGKLRITASGEPKLEYMSFEGDEKLIKAHKTYGVYRITFTCPAADSVTVRVEAL